MNVFLTFCQIAPTRALALYIRFDATLPRVLQLGFQGLLSTVAWACLYSFAPSLGIPTTALLPDALYTGELSCHRV